jgi:hypothetical protein
MRRQQNKCPRIKIAAIAVKALVELEHSGSSETRTVGVIG